MSSLRTFAAPRGRLALLLLPLTLPILLSACGGKDKGDIAVAEVGDHVITLGYFESKMNNMRPEDLPAGIETRAGRQELLETMIDKEVMAIKAQELGYDQNHEAMDAAEGLVTMHAVELMRNELVPPDPPVTDEEMQAYYDNAGRILQISYMLHDYEEDAREARKLVLGGEDWVDVASRFDAGDPGPSGNWTMEMRYGTIADPVEGPVFALQTGEVSEPLDSVYGYFLIRLEGESKDKTLPPLDEISENIRRSVKEQKVNLKMVEVLDQIFDEYGYKLNEKAVRVLFDALPEDLELTPLPPKEDWKSLNVRPADLDMELMRYGDEVWTLRRYYDYYEATPIVGRPRRDRRVAGLRRDLRRMVMRELMPIVAEDRGYMDRPEFVQELKEKREQVMVSTLHARLIAADVDVTNEMIADYWSANKHRYDKPEVREGRVLISSDESAVRAAYDEARKGADWTGLVKKYGDLSVMPLNDEQGRFGPARKDRSDHVATALLWAQEGEGEICAPMELPGGLWGIGRVDELTPVQESTLAELGTQVKRELESQESERIFQERLGQWRTEMEIKIYPERLDDAVYLPKATPAPEATAGTAEEAGEASPAEGAQS